MDGTYWSMFLDWLGRVLIGFIILITVLWSVLYWFTWGMGKMRIGRIESEMVAIFTENGCISEEEIEACVQEYLGESIAFRGYTIDGSRLAAEYIGDPLYIDMTYTFKTLLTGDIILGSHTDFNSAAIYGKGYLTINQNE